MTPRTLAFNRLGGTTDLPLRSHFGPQSPPPAPEPAAAPVEAKEQPAIYFPPPPKKATKWVRLGYRLGREVNLLALSVLGWVLHFHFLTSFVGFFLFSLFPPLSKVRQGWSNTQIQTSSSYPTLYTRLIHLIPWPEPREPTKLQKLGASFLYLFFPLPAIIMQNTSFYFFFFRVCKFYGVKKKRVGMEWNRF